MDKLQKEMECCASCQICEREFSEDPDHIPRILAACGHTVCNQCATTIAAARNMIVCPFDRIPTPVTDCDVRNLKKNFSILQLKDDEKFRRQQRIMAKKGVKKERRNDGTCDENSAHRASSYCKVCEADLCDECWDWVHSLTILSHHERISLPEKPVDAPICPCHPEEKAEFVCKVEKCKLMQSRVMCHVCFREGSSHQGHGYVTLQAEMTEIRTKMMDALKTAEDKDILIRKNIESIEAVIMTYCYEGQAYRDKLLELKRFRSFDQEHLDLAETKMKEAVEARKTQLENRIANQRADLDWIRKNRAAIERLWAMNNTKLVDLRFEVDMMVGRIENAVIKHPKSLATCSMCIVHVPSITPLVVEMKPAHRLEIRESYHNTVTTFIEKNTSTISSRTNMLRYKTHFLRLIERTEDTKMFSEGLSLILVVDPFDGDRDRQFVALELLENATAYENIIVGLTPFNFQAISTFLAKLVEISKRDPRVEIVYINDPEKDIEKIVDLSLAF